MTLRYLNLKLMERISKALQHEPCVERIKCLINLNRNLVNGEKKRGSSVRKLNKSCFWNPFWMLVEV